MINIIFRRTHILILAMEETDKLKTKTIEELLLFLYKSQTVTKMQSIPIESKFQSTLFHGCLFLSVQTMHIDLSGGGEYLNRTTKQETKDAQKADLR